MILTRPWRDHPPYWSSPHIIDRPDRLRDPHPGSRIDPLSHGKIWTYGR